MMGTWYLFCLDLLVSGRFKYAFYCDDGICLHYVAAWLIRWRKIGNSFACHQARAFSSVAAALIFSLSAPAAVFCFWLWPIWNSFGLINNRKRRGKGGLRKSFFFPFNRFLQQSQTHPCQQQIHLYLVLIERLLNITLSPRGIWPQMPITNKLSSYIVMKDVTRPKLFLFSVAKSEIWLPRKSSKLPAASSPPLPPSPQLFLFLLIWFKVQTSLKLRRRLRRSSASHRENKKEEKS